MSEVAALDGLATGVCHRAAQLRREAENRARGEAVAAEVEALRLRTGKAQTRLQRLATEALDTETAELFDAALTEALTQLDELFDAALGAPSYATDYLGRVRDTLQELEAVDAAQLRSVVMAKLAELES